MLVLFEAVHVTVWHFAVLVQVAAVCLSKHMPCVWTSSRQIPIPALAAALQGSAHAPTG